MKKTKRKLRYDRLLLIALELITLIILLIVGVLFILDEQAKARENTYARVEVNDKVILLNANDFISYNKGLLDLSFEEAKEVLKEDEPELISLGEFRLTAYCDCPICQEEWVGTTAIGVAPQINHTIAVDPDIIPYGTRVLIRGKEYIAEDCGGMINDKHIDIFVGSHEECYEEQYNGYAEVFMIIDSQK